MNSKFPLMWSLFINHIDIKETLKQKSALFTALKRSGRSEYEQNLEYWKGHLFQVERNYRRTSFSLFVTKYTYIKLKYFNRRISLVVITVSL